MKKNKLLFAVCSLLIGCTFLSGCNNILNSQISNEGVNQTINKSTVNEDSLKFKDEYESLNGIIPEGKTNPYLGLSIPEENPIKYIGFQETMDLLESGTGVLYLGFPECPWCRNLVPVLLESAQENRLANVYYYNSLEIRDKKHLDNNGDIVIDKYGTPEYYQLVDKLKDYLGEYKGLNDPAIKRLYFPTTVFIRSGKIIGVNIGTIESHEDSAHNLTSEERQELKGIINKYVEKIYSDTCKEDC